MSSSQTKLKLDNWIKRDPDRSRHPAVKPLTKAEQKRLSKNCWERCLRAYRSRMLSSALLSDFEADKDLDGEAWMAMLNILAKFDKSKCGPIAKFDVPGADKPKTLEFYFINYFYGRVNFIACEARAHKKQRGVGPAQSIDEVTYDPEDTSSLSEYNHTYEITGAIFSALKKKEPRLQRFFHQTYRLQLTQRELREEYGEEFNTIRMEMTKFINEIQKSYKLDYSGAGE